IAAHVMHDYFDYTGWVLNGRCIVGRDQETAQHALMPEQFVADANTRSQRLVSAAAERARQTTEAIGQHGHQLRGLLALPRVTDPAPSGTQEGAAIQAFCDFLTANPRNLAWVWGFFADLATHLTDDPVDTSTNLRQRIVRGLTGRQTTSFTPLRQ